MLQFAAFSLGVLYFILLNLYRQNYLYYKSEIGLSELKNQLVCRTVITVIHVKQSWWRLKIILPFGSKGQNYSYSFVLLCHLNAAPHTPWWKQHISNILRRISAWLYFSDWTWWLENTLASRWFAVFGRCSWCLSLQRKQTRTRSFYLKMKKEHYMWILKLSAC